MCVHAYYCVPLSLCPVSTRFSIVQLFELLSFLIAHTSRTWILVDIRSLGWRRGLSVSFPKANYTVRAWSSNALSNMWENTCCYILCHITIVPCIAMRCYRDCGGHMEQGVRSVFRIDYHPLQVCKCHPCDLDASLAGTTGVHPSELA